MRKCPACKTVITNENAKFCRKCGAKLPTLECETDDEDIINSDKTDKETGEEEVEEQTNQLVSVEDDKPSIPLVYTSEWLKSNTEMKGWLLLFFVSIFLGGLLSVANSFKNYDNADYGGSVWFGVGDIFISVSLFAIALYTIYAFIQRKSNALFYGRLYCLLVLIGNIIVAIGGDLEAKGIMEAVRGIIWSIVWFLYLLLSNQVKRVIPKSFRKVKKYDWIILAVLIIIPVICIAVGVVNINSKNGSRGFFNSDREEVVDTAVVEEVDTVAVDPAVVNSVVVDGEDDIEEVEVESPEVKNLRLLKADIEESNKSFPMDIEEGLTIKKMYMYGDYVIYYVVCDEDVIDMDVLSQNKSKLRRIIKKNLNNADENIRKFKRMCKNANKGIGYKYVGDTSEKSFSIRFSSSEL